MLTLTMPTCINLHFPQGLLSPFKCFKTQLRVERMVLHPDCICVPALSLISVKSVSLKDAIHQHAWSTSVA